MTTTTISATTPTVIRRGDGTTPSFSHPALPRVEVKLDGSAGLGLSMLEYVVPPRFSPPPILHRHTRESAVGYLVAGHVTYWFEDGQAHPADPGSVVLLPQGAWFRWENDSDEPATLLFVFTPAGFEQFFLDVLNGVGDAGGDPSAIGTLLHPLRAAYGDEDRPAQ